MGFTSKKYAAALQRRCASEFGDSKKSGVEVTQVFGRSKYDPKGDYTFQISGSDWFEFRGRLVREERWRAIVRVHSDGSVTIEPMKVAGSDDAIPEEKVRCAFEGLSSADYEDYEP
jgi:hypothetical protein